MKLTLYSLNFFRSVKSTPASSHQIKKKKEELISKISVKLEVLRAELISLKSETKSNEEIGRQITVKVMQVAQPNECEKYKLHVEEIDKITSLLLGLAARLARAENAFALCTDQSEKVRIRYGILFYKFAQKSFTKKAMKCRHSKEVL